MVENAKLFIEFESKAKNYNELKEELRKEFGQKINSAIIHQRLKDRKKKKEENSTQYLYEMLSIAAHSDLDHAAVITYTIEGLPGSIEMKSFMFEAETINLFKKKLQAYDLIMKNTKTTEFKRNQEKTKDNNEVNPRCSNCGQFHSTSECPSIEKGPKCFTCNQFGHRSSSCLANKSEDTRRMNMIKRLNEDSDDENSNDVEKANNEGMGRMFMIRSCKNEVHAKKKTQTDSIKVTEKHYESKYLI